MNEKGSYKAIHHHVLLILLKATRSFMSSGMTKLVRFFAFFILVRVVIMAATKSKRFFWSAYSNIPIKWRDRMRIGRATWAGDVGAELGRRCKVAFVGEDSTCS